MENIESNLESQLSDRVRPQVPGDGISKNSSTRLKSKTALRIRYEAESEFIKRKIGDLEQIRATLGLSQRRICQLLFVDPSAWSRWTQGNGDAPPHIYRMLLWYLALEDKYPALDVNFWLNGISRVTEKTVPEELKKLSQVQDDLKLIKTQVQILNERPVPQVLQHVPSQDTGFSTKVRVVGAGLVGLALGALATFAVFSR